MALNISIRIASFNCNGVDKLCGISVWEPWYYFTLGDMVTATPRVYFAKCAQRILWRWRFIRRHHGVLNGGPYGGLAVLRRKTLLSRLINLKIKRQLWILISIVLPAVTIPYPEPVYTGWSSVHWNATGMPMVDPVYTGIPLGHPANTCRVHWNTTGKT